MKPQKSSSFSLRSQNSSQKHVLNNYIPWKHLDTLGSFTALLCGLHCAVIPFLSAVISLTSIRLFTDPKIEIFIFVSSVTIGIVTLLPSFRYLHHKLAPLILFLLGIINLLLSHVFDSILYEVLLTSFGAILLTSAHLYNRRLTHLAKK
jgi:hypothetical protein